MPFTNTHPEYEKLKDTWLLLRDAYEGEEIVKERGTTYLPATPGQVLDGMQVGGLGLASYTNYKARAVFPDFYSVGVETLVGILNAKETVIELPPELEYLRVKATFNGTKLADIIRKIHEEQLIVGRLGLLADLPADPDQVKPQQYIELYEAEKILNWDDGSFNEGFNKLNLVVLDESGYEREGVTTWKLVDKYRVLSLGQVGPNEPIGLYQAGTFASEAEIDTAPLTTPMLKGTTLDEIPFVFIGSKDINPTPDKPPLKGLAELCMQIYRAEADYRYTLFMQGQDTLVVVGGVRNMQIASDGTASETDLRVGAGARIDVNIGGDAKYIGIGAAGLPEQRTSLEADRNQAAVRTGQLLAPGKMSMESGEALKTRVAAQTATLTSVAITAASALELLLKTMAKWQGGDAGKVKVIPNLDFTNVNIEGQDVVQLQTAKNLGAPLSARTVHDALRGRGLTKRTFDEEIEELNKDPATLKEIVESNKSKPQGNNPGEAAGGGKKAPVVKGTKTGNKPVK